MYFMIFIDDISKKVWEYFMRHKSKNLPSSSCGKLKLRTRLGKRLSAFR
jgi:hypothetical protein